MTSIGKSKDNNLVSVFSNSVELYPNNVALFVDNEKYTYRELGHFSAELFEHLPSDSNGKTQIVGVLANRSIVAYSSILAILATGSAYLPLNPKFPKNRIAQMLDLSEASHLVVGEEYLELLEDLLEEIKHPITVLVVSNLYPDDLGKSHSISLIEPSAFNPSNYKRLEPKDVEINAFAYLMFTSGSTGEPKGVPISHLNVKSYLRNIYSLFKFQPNDRVTQFFDLTFDLSVHDMFVTWGSGAALYCVPQSSLLAPVNFIRTHQITVWFSVPSMAIMLDKYNLLSPENLPSLRFSFFCGEALPESIVKKWKKSAKNSEIINLYGPTETTIAIYYYCWQEDKSAVECQNGIVPIGNLFPSHKALIIPINEVDEIGELLLSGVQVASGYYKNETQTNEKFIEIPGYENETWYKTGDLVLQDAIGYVHFLGRVDNQVKILGYRVELQEIESILRVAADSEAVVAIPWPYIDGTAVGLVSFIQTNSASSKSERELQTYCQRELPQYMIPKRIYFLESFPLNQNGKIDRKKLQEILEKESKGDNISI